LRDCGSVTTNGERPTSQRALLCVANFYKVKCIHTERDVSGSWMFVSHFLGYVFAKKISKMGWNLTKMSQKIKRVNFF